MSTTRKCVLKCFIGFFIILAPTKVGAQTWSLNGNSCRNAPRCLLGTTDASPLVVQTNGVEAMRIDPSHQIGVGTATPAATMHIISSGGSDVPQLRIEQSSPSDFARLRFQSFSRDPLGELRVLSPWDISVGRGQMNFFLEAKGNILSLTTDGSVGVGTDAPTARLHVVGDRMQLTAPCSSAVCLFQQLALTPSGVSAEGLNSLTLKGTQGVEVDGNLTVNGSASVKVLQITGGSDVAEGFPTESNTEIDAGTVVVIDSHHPGEVRVSDTAYDHKVAGIVSGADTIKPGLILGQKDVSIGTALVAVVGRVYCKADDSSGPIEPGDVLTTSARAGFAMKADDPNRSRGAILGKAMTGLKEGTGLVLVLVNLQ